MPDFLRNLGKRIATLRTAAGMKQTELADKAGLSPGYMSRLERGETNISILNLRVLADALDIPLVLLLDCEKNPSHEELAHAITRNLSDIASADLACLHRFTALLKRREPPPKNGHV